jgi:hypothetical protein
MMDHAPQADLPCRIADGLRESCGRNDDWGAVLQGCGEDCEDAAIISFQGNQAASIKRDAFHAAFRRLAPRFRGKSIPLAHARSFGVSGPPVAFEASCTMARNSAAFSRDF